MVMTIEQMTIEQSTAVLAWQGYEFMKRLPDALAVRVYGRRHRWHEWRREGPGGQRYVFLMIWPE